MANERADDALKKQPNESWAFYLLRVLIALALVAAVLALKAYGNARSP